jgi:hypothetical protein
MRLLFLDFHGVLHPSPCPDGALFGRAPLLADALRDAPQDVRVVIASTWRGRSCARGFPSRWRPA